MLRISVEHARPAPHTAAPAITFRLRVEDESGDRIHAVALRCRTCIEPRGRRYSRDEQARLYELFGDPSQWHRTLATVTWAHSALLVPSFERAVDVDLPVACTYDLEVGAAKYLHAVREGDVPLAFVFSGTVFRTRTTAEQADADSRARDETGSAAGRVWIEPVPWDVEASFRLPASVWQAAMDTFFPGGGWLRLSRETIDRLQAFRGREAIVSWDEAVDLLLRRGDGEAAAPRVGAANTQAIRAGTIQP